MNFKGKIFLFVSGVVLILFFCTLKLYSQSSSSQKPFDSYTITLTGDSLSQTTAVNITVVVEGGVTKVVAPVTFSASGATLVLSDVNSNTGVVTLVWSGNVTGGKIKVTGKINAVNEKPILNVTKIEAAGGKDITNEVSSQVEVFSSVVDPTPTPTPEVTTPTPTATPTPDNKDKPLLSISGTDTISLSSRRTSKAKLIVSATNFQSTARCESSASDSSLLSVRPKKFFLSQARAKRRIIARVPFLQRKNIKTQTSVILNVSCNNGASIDKELTIQPP